MPGPFIFIATNRLRDGRFDAEQQRVPELVRFIEAHEPRLIAFNGHPGLRHAHRQHPADAPAAGRIRSPAKHQSAAPGRGHTRPGRLAGATAESSMHRPQC